MVSAMRELFKKQGITTYSNEQGEVLCAADRQLALMEAGFDEKKKSQDQKQGTAPCSYPWNEVLFTKK